MASRGNSDEEEEYVQWQEYQMNEVALNMIKMYSEKKALSHDEESELAKWKELLPEELVWHSHNYCKPCEFTCKECGIKQKLCYRQYTMYFKGYMPWHKDAETMCQSCYLKN